MPGSRALTALVVTLAALVCRSAVADDYPSRPIHLITSGAGGPSDVMARIIAEGIAKPLGQPVVVENRVPLIAYDAVARAAPDGYTIYVAGAYFTTLKLLQANATADPIKDFAAITITDQAPCILVTNPDLPVKSLKELIDLARAKPGVLNFAAGPIGTAAHLGAELLRSMAGIDIVTINYKSTPEANLSVITGTNHMTLDTATSLTAHIKSGKLRAIGVTTAQPSPLAPGVPTMAASGLPGFEMKIIGGLYAPVGTPQAIIDRLNQETVRVLRQPDVTRKLLASGTEVVANSPVEAAAMVKADVSKWSRVLKRTGVARQ